MTPLFVGNWKMNMTAAESYSFWKEFSAQYTPLDDGTIDAGIAPTYLSISALSEAVSSAKGVMLGAQNVHWLDSGAHTGEVSANMLVEAGVDFAIAGHSERRTYYGETDETVAKRAKAAIDAGLKAIVCVGETKEQFEAGETDKVVSGQISKSLEGISDDETENLIVAYEPVWAIGTGLAATPEIANDVHNKIRKQLNQMYGDKGSDIYILYGGSTKPGNIAELIVGENINGALIGGASLKPESFVALINNGRQASKA